MKRWDPPGHHLAAAIKRLNQVGIKPQGDQMGLGEVLVLLVASQQALLVLGKEAGAGLGSATPTMALPG